MAKPSSLARGQGGITYHSKARAGNAHVVGFTYGELPGQTSSGLCDGFIVDVMDESHRRCMEKSWKNANRSKMLS